MKNYFFIVVFLLIVIAVFFPLVFLQVTALSCKSNLGDCPVSIVDKLAEIRGTKVISTGKKIKMILTSDILIKNFGYYYKFPSTYDIVIVERQAKYTIKNLNSENWLILDSDGMALEYSTTAPKQSVVYTGGLPVIGDRVADKIVFGLNLNYEIARVTKLQASKIDADKLTITTADNIILLLPLQGNPDIIVGGVNLVISRLNSNLDELSINKGLEVTVDFRFRNPVLRVS